MPLISCKVCGKPIADSAKTCPHCGAPVVKDVYCPNCGTKMSPDVRFCPACGAPISQGKVSEEVNGKNKLVAGLLAIFLGYLGIHYFYIGKTTAGLITIILALCTCGVWSVITFIQGIVMLTMTDDAFNAKYVSNDITFPVF